MWMRKKRHNEKRIWWLRFYRPAEWVLGLFDSFRSEQSREKERQQYREIYVGTDSEQEGKREKVKQLVYVALVVLITIVLALFVELKSSTFRTKIIENRIYRRNDAPVVELYWTTEGENGTLSFTCDHNLLPQSAQ